MAPCVAPRDLDPAGEAPAVKVRHESGQRAEQRGLAGIRTADDRDKTGTEFWIH